MKKSIESLLTGLIKDALKDLSFDQVYKEEIYLDFPTDCRFGDFTTNIALKLSKLLKRPPYELAKELIVALNNNIKKSVLKDCLQEIKVEGAGFINFYLNDKYFYEQLKEVIVHGAESLKQDLGGGKI